VGHFGSRKSSHFLGVALFALGLVN
jgi:hypothetical protein